MARSLVEDAFLHHIWATKRLAGACLALTPEQLTAKFTGTYGSILDTLRHIVGSDAFDQSVLTGRSGEVLLTHRAMDVRQLSAAAETLGKEWMRLLAENLDADAMVPEVDPDDGFQRDASVGVRIAQALHHGNEHRTHVCTALTSLGIEPLDVSVFKFALETGRSTEVLPPS